MKEHLNQQCKACLERAKATSNIFDVKVEAMDMFHIGVQCFTDLFDTEEEVLQWLEDEKMI
jgi:hypothetical protein